MRFLLFLGDYKLSTFIFIFLLTFGSRKMPCGKGNSLSRPPTTFCPILHFIFYFKENIFNGLENAFGKMNLATFNFGLHFYFLLLHLWTGIFLSKK